MEINESTGTGSLEEAERYLAKRIAEIRAVHTYGERPRVNFEQCAARFIEEHQHQRSIGRTVYLLDTLVRYIGQLDIQEIHDGTLAAYKADRLKTVAAGTVNRELATVRRILTLAARRWRHENGRPFIDTPPLLSMVKGPKRQPMPLTRDEEQRLLAELPDHLRDVATFLLQTGLRQGEAIALRWGWLQDVEGLGAVFVLPGSTTKNGEERAVVLNSMARRIVEAQRGKHAEFVFTYEGEPLARLLNSAWRKARVRAGLRGVRVHDLRHTVGHRLRAAGVSLEDRKAILGHTNGDVTTHYSAPELERLLEAAERLVSGAPGTVLRASQVRALAPAALRAA